MAKVAGKLTMRTLTVALGIPLGIAGRKLARRAFETARPQAPGHDPADPRARWGDIVSWAALSSAAVVLADLVARRSAEEIWRFFLGSEPPPPSGSPSRRKVKVRD